MVTVQVDLVKFNRDFEKFKNQFELILREIAVDFTRRFLIEVIGRTNIGDAQTFLDLYEERQKKYGYFPIEGLAKGSWITELNNPSGIISGVYDTQSRGEAVQEFFEPEIKNFKLGDTVYITNKLHYIEFQANGDLALARTYSRATNIFDSVVKKTNRLLRKQRETARGA